jgi:hypothetical protein
VDAAVAAAGFGEAELRAHPGAVRAGVDPVAAREAGQQRVDGPRHAARRRAAVHDLRDAAERDARAPARQAACSCSSLWMQMQMQAAVSAYICVKREKKRGENQRS